MSLICWGAVLYVSFTRIWNIFQRLWKHCQSLDRVGWGKAPPLRSQRPTDEYIAHNKELSNAHKEAYEGNIKNDKIIIPSYLLRYYER